MKYMSISRLVWVFPSTNYYQSADYQKLALIQTCAEFRADFEIQRVDQVFI